tara:strand:+ start:130 stop:744 length:615 start_codon:yes stop_codon:yes gene_type:complete
MDIDKAINHLQKVDSRMKTLIKKYGHPKFSPIDNYFEALIKSIVSQQISTKAASAIYNRLKTLFNGDHFPNPKNVLAVKDEKLMSVGLSGQKIKYIKDLSNKWDQIEIKLSNIKLMTDQEIRDILLDVKGIGHWTVDMFLIFSLVRPDIFPTGDLAMQKGFCILNNLDSKPSVDEMIQYSEIWRPYRTIASWYLWILVEGPTEW